MTDRSGEAYYIRDETVDILVTNATSREETSIPYVTRHGFGYSVFEHTHDGIHRRSDCIR